MSAPSPLSRSDARQPVLVVSHPRSGTHLAMDLIRRHFASTRNWRCFGLPLDHLYLNLERLGADQRRFSPQKATRIVNRPKRAMLKTHFTSDFTSSWARSEAAPPLGAWRVLAEQALTLYVVRHPMDVMVSYHQFLSALDPQIADMDLMRFMHSAHWDDSTDRLGWWQEHLRGWCAAPHAHVTRYEDVVRATGQTLKSLSAAFEETPLYRKPLLPPKVTTLRHARMNRLFHLAPQSTAIIADRRRFPARDWRVSLSAENKRELSDRLSGELARFEYRLDEAPRSRGQN